MPRKRRVLVVVLTLILLPSALALTEAVSFYSRHHHNGRIVSSGREREYVLYVPPTYDHTKPTPLVISLHGAGLWGGAQKEISQWNETADEHGFIVVYPSAIKRGPRVWRANRDPIDVKFIADLIDALHALYNIDRRRIYANGLSNGGGMSFVLSCALPDRFAAVGMVAAAQLSPFDWCRDRPAVPMIAFHGTDDRMTPYHGGKTWVAPRPFPDIPTFTANWARRNKCAPAPIESAVAGDVTRRSYTNCADGADVVLYTIAGGGHTWPGGQGLAEWFAGPTSASVDASREMWAFFRDHPLTVR